MDEDLVSLESNAIGLDPAIGVGPAIALGPMLDMGAAAPLHETLIEARGRDIVLDATEVRHLGAQCAQLLVSAAATWRADDHSFSIEPRSPEFEDGIRLLGLESIFQGEI